MGGIGSGRDRHDNPYDTVTQYNALDIRLLKKSGLLNLEKEFVWQCSLGKKIAAHIMEMPEINRRVFFYRQQGKFTGSHCHAVFLESTPCHFGGERFWFICPAKNCGRRVAILYGGKAFACRRCYGLTYPSQRENADVRALNRTNKDKKEVRLKNQYG